MFLEEPIDAPLPENDPLQFSLDRVQWSESWQESTEVAASLMEVVS